MAPERSGKKQWVHWRLQCPKFLRQTFVEWAGKTIPRSFWAAAYYRQQRDRGCSHHAALRAHKPLIRYRDHCIMQCFYHNGLST
ncbi:MAG: hypothetical protein ACREV3_10080 [Gammaproteobacteria bacterium]